MTHLSARAQLLLFTGDIYPDGRLVPSTSWDAGTIAAASQELVAAGLAMPCDPHIGQQLLCVTTTGRKALERLDLADLVAIDEGLAMQDGRHPEKRRPNDCGAGEDAGLDAPPRSGT